MKVMVLGATGLTGNLVVQALLSRDTVEKVVVPLRRKIEPAHPKLEQHLVSFDQLPMHREIFKVDALVCCLGTTIKKAGSREKFRQVDYEYALTAAELAREQVASTMILMSAVGASASSPVFYNRVKGELENAVRELGFENLSIYHPSLLLGERQEHRTAESLGMAVMPVANRLMMGPLRKYRSIEAETVANAMANELDQLQGDQAGRPPLVRIHEFDGIMKLAWSQG